MTYAALFCCLALIWYAAAMTAGALVAAPLLDAASRIAEPSVRARKLVLLRSLPTVGALLVTGLGLVPAFLWLEPRQTTESVSGGMIVLAVGAAAVIFAGPARGLVSFWATRQRVRGWERASRPVRVPGTVLPAFAVDESFPVAALVGWRRPRLFLARSVLESCDAAELAAVAAHELGHLRRGDHWKRLLMRAAPDILSFISLGDEVERRWADAAEQLADEHASATGPSRALDLASALVKVARLVARAPRDLPLIALYRGEGVAGRVERLLRPPRDTAESVPRRTSGLGPVLALLLAVGPVLYLSGAFGLDVLHRVHTLAEALVLLFQ